MLVQQRQIAMTLSKSSSFLALSSKNWNKKCCQLLLLLLFKTLLHKSGPIDRTPGIHTCGQKNQTTLLAIATWTGHWWAINCQSISGCSGNQQLAEERQKFLAETLSAFASGWRSWALGPLPSLEKLCSASVANSQWENNWFSCDCWKTNKDFFASGWSPLLGISDPR